ncbi:unnamed protein product [Rotaria sordida]|uniref:Uncharacterized protein n=1 Tax=Rotaria sordida TaxID=392033 RepID=A0A814AHC8_9BILA|nr:unnamed protein product [Rotaria sordida]
MPLHSAKTLYRGQIISAGELQLLKDNIGGVYSVNAFFSSSTNSNVALTFQTGTFGKPYFECVLFEILVDNKTDSKWKMPFADIHDVSFNKDEGEVLFGMGSVFCIVDVTAFTSNLWLAAIKLYQQALRINAIALPFDHPATACICDHLGDVYRRLGNRKLSRKYYNHGENMARACLGDRPHMKQSENEKEILTYDQSTAELDFFTQNYLASINNSDSLVVNNMTINSTA